MISLHVSLPQRTARVTLALLAGVTLSACASTTENQAPASPSSADSSSSAPASSASSRASSSSATAQPTAGPTSSDLPAPVPTVSAEGANISVFAADITQAQADKTPANQMHAVPGEQAVRVTLKLRNLSDQPADATNLSFPTLLLDGTPIQGATSEDTPAFGTLEAGQSQEATFFFPSTTIPHEVEVKLDDGRGTSTVLTHPTH